MCPETSAWKLCRVRKPLLLVSSIWPGTLTVANPSGRNLSASGLRRICREDDCVARMGEGFVLALGGSSARDLPEKRRLIEGLLAELAPSDSSARPLVPRIGAAYYPDDGGYAEDLLACADLRLNGVLLEKNIGPPMNTDEHG